MLLVCKRLGFSSEELERMLKFYAEVGTIVYFPTKGEERGALNKVSFESSMVVASFSLLSI